MGRADNDALKAMWEGGRSDNAAGAVNTSCRDDAADEITTG